MITNNSADPLQVGATVKIRDSGYGPAKIVEYRGAIGPRGAKVYRLRVRNKPKPAYIEVLEDQIETIITDK